jgi:hypothetical protein
MAINLKTPGTLNLTFVNTVAGDFTSAGYKGNSVNSAYAKTGITSLDLNLYSTHYSVFADLNISADSKYILGSYNLLNRQTYMLLRSATGVSYACMWQNSAGQGTINGAVDNSLGNFVATRIADNDFTLYQNAVSKATGTGTTIGTMSPCELYLMAWNNMGTAGNFSNQRLQLVTIGTGWTSTNVTNENTAAQIYNNDR